MVKFFQNEKCFVHFAYYPSFLIIVLHAKPGDFIDY